LEQTKTQGLEHFDVSNGFLFCQDFGCAQKKTQKLWVVYFYKDHSQMSKIYATDDLCDFEFLARSLVFAFWTISGEFK
jgi:hypothetical protein